jgi:hypothetical protein
MSGSRVIAIELQNTGYTDALIYCRQQSSNMKFTAIAAALLAVTGSAYADENAELNQFLEDNAVAAAYARMCDEEPMAEQLKANTMMLLAVHGVPPHNVQLGSAKWGEILRREFAAVKGASSVNCPSRVAEAKARLEQTQKVIQATRRQ